MIDVHDQPVLIAEPVLADAVRLAELLRRAGCDVRIATSSRAAIERLRRRAFTRAIVAVELVHKGELLLARLRRLPALDRLVGTGPAGCVESERRARQAGATAYVVRPASPTRLVPTLSLPPPLQSDSLHAVQDTLRITSKGNVPVRSRENGCMGKGEAMK